MQVLVLNSGSSSIKYQLFEVVDDPDEGHPSPAGSPSDEPELRDLATGLIERIGEPEGRLRHRFPGEGGAKEDIEERHIADHADGFDALVTTLEGAGLLTDLAAIGHRVVHGGARFVAPAVIDDEVIAGIREHVPLAPLHNPANLTGIEVATRLRPDVHQVAVFDTAFHATLPPHAYRYAVPDEVLDQHGVRRYGFHGTSHAFVARRAAAHLGRDDLAMITLHLGNGASAAAIDAGRSIDTSMGLSPLEGLVMGTRSGDLDPAVVFHLVRQAGMTLDEVDQLLNRKSGLLGLCGANDLREIETRAAGGDDAAELALTIYAYRIRKYLGAYTAALGRLDAVVFTAGVGENGAAMRARIIDGLDVLGLRIDPDRNATADVHAAADGVVELHPAAAEVAVLAVATDEEREIATQSLTAVAGLAGRPTRSPSRG
jgi:acetate kinase